MQTKTSVEGPVAAKIEKKISLHDHDRIDNYYWLNERTNEKVVRYLEDENEYLSEKLQHTEPLQEELYSEIIGRIKQTDMSVPYKYNGYFYATKYQEGQEYPIYTRHLNTLEAPEQVLLDVNQLAEGYDYYNVNSRTISQNNSLMAFGEDTLSRRIYTIRFKNLVTGDFLSDRIENTTGHAVWANDNQTVFYARRDSALRPYQILKHTLGTDPADDPVVFEESDETYNCFVYKTKSDAYICIGSVATLSSEFRLIDANRPNDDFRVFHPREEKLEYEINHFGNKFYILTNYNAKNFRLMQSDLDSTNKRHWKEVIPHRNDVLLEDIDVFSKYLVLSERKAGIVQLRVLPTRGRPHYIQFPEDAHYAYTTTNPDFNTEILRFGYTSMTSPTSTFDYNMRTRKRTLLKKQEILGNYYESDYTSERINVPARDGQSIPMSIVYRKDFPKDSSSPVLLYAYGSYGYSMDPYFSLSRLSLLNRGFAFAIAHVRGGEELGRQWYEDGKLLKKQNTFNDFIDCAQYLIDNNFTSAKKLCAMGGSAGGLLIGAVANQAPQLFQAMVAQVPFVDVVTTMMDENIPLTTGEYDEWGNPSDPKYYDYMLTYSPYDNIKKQAYPSMLVTTGLHDSQVQYWEPAKWVAKLRQHKTDKNPLLLYCNMDTGHGGASGRFQQFKETAMEYAFLLDQVSDL